MKGVRFAPSPTGPFHAGNLRTAWISSWWAKHLKEPWVVRFEDIDALRNAPGAREKQLEEMAALGLWPDEILVQSAAVERHWQVFERAARAGKAYPCFCSRREVKDALEGAASAPHAALPIYSGKCRELKEYPTSSAPAIAWRFRNTDPAHDFVVGRAAPVARPGGVPSRDSFAPAYHWACAIDDYDGDYRLLVRASDLAGVIDYQRAIGAMLLEWKGAPLAHPAIFHCSLVTRDDGARLEKRTPGAMLPEILAAGVSAEQLVKLFEKSFDSKKFAAVSSFASGTIFGEKLDTLSVAELGLP